MQILKGLVIPSGAGAGKVLTSDASGNATWQTVAASGATYVTSLPASPVDGREVYYQADGTNGVIWHLRYRSGSASSFKWEFVGGPRLFAEVATSQATTSTTFVDLTTVGPSVTVPLAGDYEIDYGLDMWNNTAAQYCAGTVKLGAAAAADADSAVASSHVAGQETSAERTIVRTGLAASAALKLMYRVTAGTGTFQKRWIAVRPRRVG